MSTPAPNHPSDMRAWLRSLPALTGRGRPVDVAALPAEPLPLFLSWIRLAADQGVPEPHAATLATVDRDGMPDARTLLLKDADARGWAFAGPRSSGKGIQLAVHAVAALNFWWQPLARAVRLRGPVREATPAESAADLAARSPAARDGVAAGDWVLWRLQPSRVEFWQGATDRRHTRIMYEVAPGGWGRHVSGTTDT